VLEVITKFICSSIMTINGFLIVGKILGKRPIEYNRTAIFWLLILDIISLVLYPIQYTGLYTIMIFLLNIMVYKQIFKTSLEEAIISTSAFMVILFFADLIITIPLRIFFTVPQIRTLPLVSIFANLLICITSVIFINMNPIYKQLKKFYDTIIVKKAISNIIFFVSLIIGFSSFAYNITASKTFNLPYVLNSVEMIIFVIITYIFIKNRNNYNELSDKYDNLFSYIQNFEDWIEKEQLNRHEYKNQLAVLRCLTKETKVKKKIDEILEDNINIENDTINSLKTLPKGGFKGLMYYKSAIAQKHKINLTIEVSLKNKSLLHKLPEQDMRVLCKLIGIYFDNAIEAAKVTKKKIILIEIYNIDDKVNIIISNTFRKSKKFASRNERGVSTKGSGRGNGLYFARNLIAKNPWISEKQDVVDDYYIQEISIKKLEK